jgi:hypothetical protein
MIPTARILLADDTFVDAFQGRGTFDEPIVEGGLGSFSMDHGVAFRSMEPNSFHGANKGPAIYFRSLYSDRALPYPGSRRWNGWPGVWSLIPEDGPKRETTRIPDSSRYHFLSGGEVLPIFTDSDWLLPPSEEKIQGIIDWLAPFLDEGLLESERLSSILSLFGDKQSKPGDHGDKRDVAWLMRNWPARTGSRIPSEGWYYSLFSRWGDGPDNGHYHALMWHLLKFFAYRRPEDYAMGMILAVSRSCWGFDHTGTGLWAYEKGASAVNGRVVSNIIGESHKPSWAKQWGLAHLAWAKLSGLDVLSFPLPQYRKQFEETQLNWSGQWGARIPARYLQELRHMSEADELADQSTMRLRAQNEIDNVWEIADLPENDGITWWNAGNHWTAPSSPWMLMQLINELGQWRLLGVGVNHDLGKLTAAAEFAWTNGTYDVEGHRHLYYRANKDGTQEPRYSTLGTWGIPMCRTMAQLVPGAGWEERLAHLTSSTNDWIGSSFTRIASNNPSVAADVGIEYHEKGVGGWPKVCKAHLCCMIR